MPEDDGTLMVVEAMLVSMLLFGAVLFLLYSPLPGDSSTIERTDTGSLAADLLRVLEGSPSTASYATRLDEIVTESLLGNTDGARQLARSLPSGAGYGLYLDNGVEPLALYESGHPTGEVRSKDAVYYPGWDYQLAFADLEGHGAMSASDTMRIRTFVVRNSYLDRTSGGVLLFENGVSVPVTRDAGDALVATLVPPEAVALPDGYDTPYDISTVEAFDASVVSATADSPVPYTVRTSLLDTWSGTAYSVHPSFSIDAGLRTYAETGGHTSVAPAEARPGDAVTLTYDFTGMPLGGSTVLSRTVDVYGPAPGYVAATGTLTGESGTWTTTLPRSALYGTYVVDTRVVLLTGSLQQVVHDVTAFDVLRSGADEPGAAVYRAVVAIWFNSL